MSYSLADTAVPALEFRNGEQRGAAVLRNSDKKYFFLV